QAWPCWLRKLEMQEKVPSYPALRIHTVNHARKGDNLANVLGAANPGNRAFQTKPKARMRHAAVTAQVQIPLESFFGKMGGAEPLHQQAVIMNALAATDDFAVALGGEHVEGECKLGALRIGLHVEGLKRCGIAMDNHGPVKGAGDDGFFVSPEVVTKLREIAVLVEHGDGFFVADAGEGRFDALQLLDVALERFKFARFVFEDALDDGTDQPFAESHGFVQFHVSCFRFKHPEFREVAAIL